MAFRIAQDPLIANITKIASSMSVARSRLSKPMLRGEDPIQELKEKVGSAVTRTIEPTGRLDVQTNTASTLRPWTFTPMYTAEADIVTAQPVKVAEGEKAQLFYSVANPMKPSALFGAQLGGTITQHPEKQGFERGVTAAGFPTQEQMTGLGFRQGAASYKPQKYQLGTTVMPSHRPMKYAHGKEVIQNEQPPIEQLQEEVSPQAVTRQPDIPIKVPEGQQTGNIEAAQEADLSAKPELIQEPQAAPPQQAADDVQKTVPEGSFVINSAAVKIAGLDYIEKIVADAIDVAYGKGITIAAIGKAKGKEAVDILISNGEVVIPPELVGVIGEHTLTLINNKGIAAMKQQEQAQAGQPQSGEYGGGQAYGGFIDRKKGYAIGKEVEQNEQIPIEPTPVEPDVAEEFGIPIGTAEWETRALNPETPTTPDNETVRTVSDEHNGKTILFPTIRMVEGKLTSDFDAKEVSIQNNDFYVFDSPTEADKYSLELSDRIGLSREQKQQVQ